METKNAQTFVQLKYAVILAALAVVGVLIYAASIGDFDELLEQWLFVPFVAFATFLGSFLVLRAWATVRHHPHEGWRRLLFIFGVIGFVAGATVGYDMIHYGKLYLSNAFEMALYGLGGFAATVFGLAGLMWLVKWVREGFHGES